MYDLGGRLDGHRVEPGTNLLVSGPPMSGKTALGFELLGHGAREGEGSVVVTNKDGARRVRAEHPALFEHDTPVRIVDCITKSQGHGTIADTDAVQYVSSPEDMTGIGIRASDAIEAFHEQGIDQTRLLFVSLSTLLLYADVQTVFRFLHVFTSRIEAADALGLFVVDAAAHDDQTMNTISQLFDGLLRLDADGELTPRLP